MVEISVMAILFGGKNRGRALDGPRGDWAGRVGWSPTGIGCMWGRRGQMETGWVGPVKRGLDGLGIVPGPLVWGPDRPSRCRTGRVGTRLDGLDGLDSAGRKIF